jgi:hypothetical protein
MTYHTCCVHSTAGAIHATVDAARDVTLATIRRHCDGIDDWARAMSYAIGPERGLHLKDDWAVSYHRSVYCGNPCYYIQHSAIEHIWL